MDEYNANASLNEVNIIANYDLLQMWFENNSVRIVRPFLMKENCITKQKARQKNKTWKKDDSRGSYHRTEALLLRHMCNCQFSLPQFVPENFEEDLVHRMRSL